MLRDASGHTEESDQSDAQAERPDHRGAEVRLTALGLGEEEGFEEMGTISRNYRLLTVCPCNLLWVSCTAGRQRKGWW